jgi:hypothetical protein
MPCDCLAVGREHTHVADCVAVVPSRAVKPAIVAFVGYGVAKETSPAVDYTLSITVQGIRIDWALQLANRFGSVVDSKCTECA